MAPELCRMEKYDQRVDVWSLGIIAYLLLSGKKPFNGFNKSELKQNILSKPIDFKQEFLKHLSKNAIDFMQKATIRDHLKRYSAKQLLDHPWIVNMNKKNEQKIDEKTHFQIV